MTTVRPRIVLGMPAYNRPDTLPRTLESLLTQTRGDFALVIVEDDPAAATAGIVDAYARDDARIGYERNTTRLGMVGNWRRVFAIARRRYPEAEYFAWVSDHDTWHPRWLAELVAVLDAEPAAVLAYPRALRVTPDDVRHAEKAFDTAGVRGRAARLRRSARHLLAGDMIYGLMRAAALQAAGVFRPVVTPDRQLLLALSLFGEVVQVPEVLWYREVLREFDLQRQRDVFFPGGASPLYSYLPSHLQHSAVLCWDFAVCGRGRPAFGRLAGLRYAATQLWWSSVRQLRQQRKSESPSYVPGTQHG